MTEDLRGLLQRLHEASQPKPGDRISSIDSAKKCLGTACRRLGYPLFTHHDFRHFFATSCIESGVDIPTVAFCSPRMMQDGSIVGYTMRPRYQRSRKTDPLTLV